jgi:hypothetical protein
MGSKQSFVSTNVYPTKELGKYIQTMGSNLDVINHIPNDHRNGIDVDTTMLRVAYITPF